MAIRTYRDLDVWAVSMTLVEDVYSATTSMPASEQYGLVNQMRRAAVSVPSNIAEGFGRGRRREYVRSLTTSRGSVCELETQIALSARLGLIDRDRAAQLWNTSQRVNAMLTAQIGALKRSRRADPIDALDSSSRESCSPSDSRVPTPESRLTVVPPPMGAS